MSFRPEASILSTDYASLKNDSESIISSFTVPGSQSIPAGQVMSWSSDINIGSISAPMIFMVRIPTDGRWYSSNGNYAYLADGTLGGTPGYNYTVNITVYRVNSTTVRATAFALNPYNAPMITEPTARTIQYAVRTYLSPFI